jgi:nitrate/TMAO reductase-like tetraheme cytochrome c subunit
VNARLRWLLPLALALAAGTLAAEEAAEWPLDPTQEDILKWAGRGVIGGACLAAAILLFLLLRRRARLLEPNSKWLLLIALGILPTFVLTGANSIILTASKTADSCATCHVMQPFLADMRNPASETLAAVHYKNRWIPDHQCYTCHSGYGIFGDYKAKKKGVGHLWKYYGDDYEKPIRHAGPFDLSHCMKCHAASAKFRAEEAHQGEDFWKDLKSGAQNCFDCHGRAHPEFDK